MRLAKLAILFTIGGLLYIFIEMIWRSIFGSHPTHWSMFILGGLSFIIIGGINEHISWEMPFWLQAFIGTAYVLLLEFVFGVILNIVLKLNVWDYSNLPMNILGQVCLPFTLAWLILVSIAIVIDDWLRYLIFKEEKPKYKWWFKSNSNK